MAAPMVSARPPVTMAGATSAARTAPGMWRIQAATKPVVGSRSARMRPAARMPKVMAVMPRMVTSASSDTAALLHGLDHGAREAADKAADDDVPVALDQPRRRDGGKRTDEPRHDVGLALPHAEQQGEEGGGEGEVEAVFRRIVD